MFKKHFLLKDILEIKEISYGEFPEIGDLNSRFKPNSKKVKLVLDINVPEVPDNLDLSMILEKLMKLLPSLERHQCGEHLFDCLKSSREPHHLSHTDKVTDIAHLLEHVIIDLQSRVTGMDSCSGITCGYKNPYYRFDLFVECKDKKVGLFSVFFAVDLFKRLLAQKSLSQRYYALIELTRYLYQNKLIKEKSELDPLADRISLKMGWKKSFAFFLLRKLKEFGLFNHKPTLAG